MSDFKFNVLSWEGSNGLDMYSCDGCERLLREVGELVELPTSEGFESCSLCKDCVTSALSMFKGKE